MDQGWIKSGHIRGDVLGPFPGSGMATGERHRASKRLQMAINKPLVAISWPGGSEMADLRGSRLDQVRTHPGGCVGTISRVRNGHWGAHFRIFVFLHFCNFQQKNENFANLEIPLLLSRTTLLCVFSTGEPCKDRLILTAIPSKFGAHGFAVLLFLFDGADIF